MVVSMRAVEIEDYRHADSWQSCNGLTDSKELGSLYLRFEFHMHILAVDAVADG